MNEEREKKRQRGECAGCPGSMMCWGGEELVGEDCVVCGRMSIGRDVSPGGDREKVFEPLGEIKVPCSEVAWHKDVCDDCKPQFNFGINESLYAMLQQYEDNQ